MSTEHDPDAPEGGTSAPAGDEPLVSPLGSRGTPSDAPGPEVSSAALPAGAPAPTSARDSHNMLPPRDRRRSPVERLFVRLIATTGIVAIGVAIGAIMISSHSKGWLVGLVVSAVSVLLAAVLWSSRQL